MWSSTCESRSRGSGAKETGASKKSPKERAESGNGGSDNAYSSLSSGPDGNIRGGIEEIGFVCKGIDVWNANNCCGGSTRRGVLA